MALIKGITKYRINKGTRYKVNTKVSGKPVYKEGFETQRAAIAYLEMYKSNSKASYFYEEIRWERLVREYCTTHLPTLKSRTQMRYRLDIDLRLTREFGYSKLDSITPKRIEFFRSKLIGKIQPKSINNCIATLSSILSKAVEWGYLSENPVKIKPLKTVKTSDDNWWKTKNHIETFYSGLELQKARVDGKGNFEPYRAALILPLETGMRLGEVTALLKSDIDFSDCTISVIKTYNEKSKQVEPTKNYESRLLRFKRRSRLHQWLEEKVRVDSHLPGLFNTRTGKPIAPSKLSNEVFQKWVSRLELPRITYHGLRHTFATWYMKRGGDIYMLYKILGHSDIKTTMSKYHHHDQSRVETMSWD